MPEVREPSLADAGRYDRKAAAEKRRPRTIGGDAPPIEIADGRYIARFARTAAEIDGALRLRFEVFNLELGEGLDASYIDGRDEDESDRLCRHLIVVETGTGAIVGTYRVLTLEAAGAADNFYCAGEFDLSGLPARILAESLEIGRACIAREHRHLRVLFLLWRGLAAFAEMQKKRYLFGCCSLTTQDASEGRRAERRLRGENCFHPELSVAPRADFVCSAEETTNDAKEFELPKLFGTYLRLGAKVCSPPAIDRRFKTIDFFVLFDIATIDEKYRRMFFA